MSSKLLLEIAKTRSHGIKHLNWHQTKRKSHFKCQLTETATREEEQETRQPALPQLQDHQLLFLYYTSLPFLPSCSLAPSSFLILG